MKKSLYIILALLFVIKLNAQDSPCFYVDPLTDIEKYLEGDIDLCCGNDLPSQVCYDLDDPLDGITQVCTSIKYFDHSNGEFTGNIPIDELSNIDNILNDIVNDPEVVFEYNEYTNTVCCYNCPIDFGNLIIGPCDSQFGDETFEPYIFEGGCPYDNIEMDVDAFLNLDENYTPEDLSIGNSPSTFDFYNDPDFDEMGGFSENQIAYLFNFVAGNGLLDNGFACLDMNCIDLSDFAQNLDDTEIEAQIQSMIDVDGSEIDLSIDEIKDLVAEELADISMAEFLNEKLGLHIPIQVCEDGITLPPYENELPPNPLVGENSNSLLSTGGNIKTEADADIFSQAIPGLGANTSGAPNGAMPTNPVNGSVNLFNGSQSSNIGIYNFQSRDISVPISISSQNNGLKVNDVGTELGQNWSLNAGPSITRSVNGIPDEYYGIIEGEGAGRVKKIDWRLELPSSFGIALKACGTTDIPNSNFEDIRDGIGKKFSSGVAYLHPKWSVFEPNLIRFDIGVLVTCIYGIEIFVEFGFSAGIVANEQIGAINYRQKSVGYLHLDDEEKMDALNINPIDFVNFQALSLEEKKDKLKALGININFEDARFLNEYVNMALGLNDIIQNKTVKTTRKIDTEPDEFYFNVPGYSGKFMFDNDGNPVVFPFTPELKVEVTNINEAVGVTEFKITTPNGLEYTFGSSNTLDGVEIRSETNFYLPNFYTYEELGDLFEEGVNQDRDRFGEAQLDLSILNYVPNIGYRIKVPYTSTYQHNYKVTKNPRYTSKWNVTQIKSVLTNELVTFEYTNETQKYYTDKSISHNFPNFNGTDEGELVTVANENLNPLHLLPSKWQNGRAEFSLNANEVLLIKPNLKKITGNRNEFVEFLYAQEKGEIVNASLLKDINVFRTDKFYKGWNFEYDQNVAPEITVECNEYSPELIESPVVVSNDTKYFLGDVYEPLKLFLYSYTRINFYIQGVDFPTQLVIPYGPKIKDELITQVFGLNGALLDVKGKSRDFLNFSESDLSLSALHLQAEHKKTFLHTIKERDQSQLTELDATLLHDFVSISYKGDLSTIAKRFSIHQDEFGYAINNTESGSPLPRVHYEPIVCELGAFTIMDETKTAFQNHYPMHNLEYSNATFYKGMSTEKSISDLEKGAISQITYSTGAYTKYNYESNYLKGELTKGGGIRVKSLESGTAESPALTKSYKYINPTYINLPTRVYQNDNGFYTKDGNTILEKRVLSSSNPLNRVYYSKANIVGYSSIIEYLGPYFSNSNGHTQYNFITKNNYKDQNIFNGTQGLIQSINSYRETKKSMFVLSDLEGINVDNTDFPSLDFSEFQHLNASLGLVYKKEVKNSNDESVQVVTNKYNYRTSHNSGNVSYFKTHYHQYNHQGSYVRNYTSRAVKAYLPFGTQILWDVINFLIDVVFFGEQEHLYKYVERDYYVQDINVRPNTVTLTETNTTNHYLATETSNSSKIKYHFNEYNFSIPYRISSYAENNLVTNQYNYFLGGIPWQELNVFDQEVKDRYELANYKMPLASKTENASGNLLAYNISGTKVVNGIVALKNNYGVRNGKLVLLGKVVAYDEDKGLPSAYRLAKYSATVNSNDELFFPTISMTYNDQLQLLTRNYESADISNTYNEYFELISAIDRDAIATDYSYDLRGRLEEVTSLNGRQQMTYQYGIGPNQNYVETEIDYMDPLVNNQSMRSTFDGLGRALSVVRGVDNILLGSTTYNHLGRVVSQFNLGSGTTQMQYEKAPISYSTTSIDDENNKVVLQQGGLSDGYYTHSKIIEPKNYITTEYFDVFGLLKVNKDAMEGETVYSYDALNRLTTIENPEHQIYSYKYNDIDKPYEVEVPNKGITKIWWDKQFRPIKTQDANLNNIYSLYDTESRILQQALFQEEGQELGEASDIFMSELGIFPESNRIVENKYVENKSWLSDNKEAVLGPTGIEGLIINTYLGIDNIGRITNSTTELGSNKYITTTEYDNAMNVRKIKNQFEGIDAGFYEYQYNFDDIIRLTTTRLNVNGVNNQLLSQFVYNEKDQVAAKLLGHISGKEFLQKVDYYYDATGKLVRINDPISLECTSDEFCDMTADMFILPKSNCSEIGLNCSKINKININGQLYYADDAISVPNQSEKLVEFIREKLDYAGIYFEDVKLTLESIGIGTVKITVLIEDSDVESIFLGFSDCPTKISFFPINCRTVDLSGSDGNIFSSNHDLFLEKMTYDHFDIARVEIDGNCITGKNRNDHSYDPLHRLLNTQNTIFGEERIDGRYNSSYSYDAIGNLLSLNRRGMTETGSFGLIDQLSYQYGTDHQLLSISEAVGSTGKGQQGSTSYAYDNKGNLISDAIKEINNIVYSANDLPVNIAIKGEEIKFQYSYGGSQIRKQTSSENRFYFGGIEFVNNAKSTLQHSDGRYLYELDQHQYFIGDHLGNTMIVFTDDDLDGTIRTEANATEELPTEVIQRNYYYSFGMQQEGWRPKNLPISETNPRNNYLYNDKELHNDEGLNWQNYGFRFYDPAIARFTTIDPLGEEFAHQSGYVYADNNPVLKIDFMGLNGDQGHDEMGRIYKPHTGALVNGINGTGNLDEITVSASRVGPVGLSTRNFQLFDGVGNSYFHNVGDTRTIDINKMDSKYGAMLNSSPLSFTKAGLTMEQVYTGYGRWENTSEFGYLKTQKFAAGMLIGGPATNKVINGGIGLFSRFRAARGATDLTTVGRWMSQAEYNAYKAGGEMWEGAGGMTFVTKGGAGSFTPKHVGSVFAEFQVPTNSLLKGGGHQWYKLIGPNANKSMIFKLQKQGGSFLPKPQNLSEIKAIMYR